MKYSICTNTSTSFVFDRHFAGRLGLTEESTDGVGRPWGIFSVDIADMEGMVAALDWILYHCQKRRNNLQYHKNQSGKLL